MSFREAFFWAVIICSAIVVAIVIHHLPRVPRPEPTNEIWTLREVADARNLCTAHEGQLVIVSRYEIYCHVDNVYFELPRKPKAENYPNGQYNNLQSIPQHEAQRGN